MLQKHKKKSSSQTFFFFFFFLLCLFRLEQHCTLLDNIKKYVENYVRALTALCLAEVKLSDDVALCFTPKDQMYEASLRNKDTIGLLDAARAEYDRVIRDDFLQVLADYLRQAGTLKVTTHALHLSFLRRLLFL